MSYESDRRRLESQRKFREKQAKGQDDLFRKQVKIKRLRDEGGSAKKRDTDISQKNYRDGLRGSWDRDVKSALSEIRTFQLKQTIKDKWLQCLEGLYISSSDAGARLSDLLEEIRDMRSRIDSDLHTGVFDLLPRPTRTDVAGLSPKTAAAILKRERIEDEAEVSLFGMVKSESNVSRLESLEKNLSYLISLYNEFQSR
ncbi:MAG TPA: hypothetical protein VIF64_03245 [Pyrinomonadaceae bacterium]